MLGKITKEEFDERVRNLEKGLKKEDTEFLEKFHEANQMLWYQRVAFAINGSYCCRATIYEATRRILLNRKTKNL